MGGDSKSRTLIVAGSALELLIVLSNNVVQSVSLSFPDSPESVTNHAEKAGKILLDDLMLRPGQSPLTKRLDRFAANFERLAILDKLTISPGLNLYEAVAGIYESLERLHQWDLRKLRADPALHGKSDEYLENMIMCTRNGIPVMHTRDRLGLSHDYWKEKRLIPSTGEREAAYIAETEKTWGLLVSCAPVGEMAIPPVRVSSEWISPEVEKASLGDDLQLGQQNTLDWLEPNDAILPAQDPSKTADALQVNTDIMGRNLPNVMFVATVDPPLNVPSLVWQQIRQFGGDIAARDDLVYDTLDSLMFPIQPGSQSDPSELRTIRCTKAVDFMEPDGKDLITKTYENTLHIYKPVYGKALKEIPFSHPQQLINMLPFLRQYAFLSALLDNSFRQKENAPDHPKPDDAAAAASAAAKPTNAKTAVTTNEADFGGFMAKQKNGAAKGHTTGGDGGPRAESTTEIDVTLSAHPVPRLQIVFPFRSTTANVVLEIRANGQVHVESQNILDETNSTAPNGRQRHPEDVGKLLETIEDIGKWCEFIRTRWA